MNEKLRKCFNTSKNLPIDKRLSLHTQKILPIPVTNPANNQLLELPQKEKHKFNLKTLFKQKTLNISQSGNTPFGKRLPSSNYNLRKNSLRGFNLKNQFNTISNNMDTLNNSFMTKKSGKKYSKNYPSEDFFPSQKTIYNNYNSGYNINPIYIKPYKNPNDFDVSEEDRIFNQYKKKKPQTKSKTKKVKTKVKIKLKKTKKINNFYSYDAALGKIYKKIPKIINKIESTKKLKGNMSLLKYQNLLMDVGSKNLNRETKQKLNNKFRTLRVFSDKSYNLLRDSLEKIERKEKKIIDSINTQQNYYKRKMKENNFYTISNKRHFGLVSLPNLKFHQIGKSKKKHKLKFK